MENELVEKEKGELVFKLIQEMKQADISILQGILIKGKNLVRIQEEELWKYYGEHFNNFDPDFLDELKYSVPASYNYMRIWRTFGKYLTSKKIFDIETTRLIKLLPIVKDETMEEWITKAKEDPKPQFKDAIREAQGKVPTDDCDHPDTDQALFTKCKICGKWIPRDLDYFKELIKKNEGKEEEKI